MTLRRERARNDRPTPELPRVGRALAFFLACAALFAAAMAIGLFH